MNTLRIVLFIAAIAAPLIGQDAKILIVEKSDSSRLAKAYREYKDALKHWEEVKADVAKSYTVQDGKKMDGWDKIQFSADFRAIVPESSPYSSRTLNGCVSGNYWTIPGGGHWDTTANTLATPVGGSGTVTSTVPHAFSSITGAASTGNTFTVRGTDGGVSNAGLDEAQWIFDEVNKNIIVKEKK